MLLPIAQKEFMSPSDTSMLKNELPSTPPPGHGVLLLNQLKSPLVYILLVAAALSIAVSDFFDAGVILFAVLLNTSLGFLQEFKASRALDALKALVQPEARVKRDGKIVTIDARDVVVGDVLVLETGDRVAADARVSIAVELQLNESTLTGESMPVTKIADDKENVFMGTTVVAGRGEAIVTEIGISTRLGQTAEMVASMEEEETPLQTELRRLSQTLSIAVLVVGLGVIIIGVSKGGELIEMVTLAAALAVATIPEGLLIGLTVILAIGMQRMLKVKALTRRLVAVETLGGVSIICTDKTGTITKGEMEVTTISADDRKKALKVAALCNNAELEGTQVRGTMTEMALLTAAMHEGFVKDALEADHQRIDEIPFSSSAKFMATLHRHGSRNMILVKGAPEVVAGFCLKGAESVLPKALVMTEKGLRVIALAMKEVGQTTTKLRVEDLHDLTCVGLVGLSDPIRPEAAQTIKEAKRAGVRTILITGDHPKTAQTIAEHAGFGPERKRVITGAELDALSESAFAHRLASIDIYARVLPAHKVRIVQAWRHAGASVAMIGDGVNDAPALKAADIGVALGNGTEVAKQTSDMVLLDSNLSTLVQAIAQGRVIFDNIRKVVAYLLTDSFAAMVLIIASFLLGLPIPIFPAQILWINLVTDGFPHMALTIEKPERGIMSEPPRPRSERVINKEMRVIIGLVGITTVALMLGLYLYLLSIEMPIEKIRTIIFTALGLNSLLYVLSIRTFRSSMFTSNPLQNPWLVVSMGVGLLFLLAPLLIPSFRALFDFVPLSFLEFGALVMLALVRQLVTEGIKFYYHYGKRKESRAGVALSA